jgi:hypothetical protein
LLQVQRGRLALEEGEASGPLVFQQAFDITPDIEDCSAIVAAKLLKEIAGMM